jgi:hypothetical protein
VKAMTAPFATVLPKIVKTRNTTRFCTLPDNPSALTCDTEHEIVWMAVPLACPLG